MAAQRGMAPLPGMVVPVVGLHQSQVSLRRAEGHSPFAGNRGSQSWADIDLKSHWGVQRGAAPLPGV